MHWMREQGRALPARSMGRQAFKIDGKFKFWGGLTIEAWGGGPGLVEALTASAKKRGVADRLRGARAPRSSPTTRASTACASRHGGKTRRGRREGVVLAAGGFQANAEWRTRYLGPGWDLAKVRGTRFNTGDGIRMALDVGAMPTGNWSGCHAVGWDRNAPEFGDLAVGDNFQKHCYPFGIMVNANGERFVDEGADFRNYTYAKYGRVILTQPGQFAWQVFDNKVAAPAARRVPHQARHQGARRHARGAGAEARRRRPGRRARHDQGLQRRRAERRAVRSQRQGRPRHRRASRSPKSNWANTIDEPPFEAYAVTCGITFTFGGVKIDRDARVLDTDGGADPRAATPPARWSAACSISTIPAAPG